MKKTSDETRAEYNLDYSKAKPNRFVSEETINYTVVNLDEDVAKVFDSKESVNNALRAIISAMPKKQVGKPNKKANRHID